MKPMDFLPPSLIASLKGWFRKTETVFSPYIGPFSKDNIKFQLVIGILALTLWFLIGTLFSWHKPPAKTSAPPLVHVSVMDSLAQEKTTFYRLQGVLEATHKATLRAETPGIITVIKAEKGQHLDGGEDILNLGIESRLSKMREAKALVDQRLMTYENAKKLQTNQFKSKTDVAQAKAQLEAAQAALAQSKSDIEDTKVKAPFKGMVDQRYVQIGDYAKAGDKLVDFVALDPLLAVGYVSEKEILSIKIGAKAQIDCQQACLYGKVSFISKIADPNSRTYRVEIQVDNKDFALPDGLTATLEIPLKTDKAHLFSPAALAMDQEGKPGVFILDEKDVAKFIPINILNHDETGIWVTGLPDRVRLITTGQYFVKPGDQVIPHGTSSSQKDTL